MGISDLVAGFIDEMLTQRGGTAEIRRGELADRFGCVPSQINYVLYTRFSPERGYAVESRRGGGGYIRIRRVEPDPALLLMHTVNAVGSRLDNSTAHALLANAVDAGALEVGTARLILAAVSDAALKPVSPRERDEARASIIKQILVNVLD